MASDWEVHPLEHLVDPERKISYGIVQPGNATAGGVPIVRVSDIRDGRIQTANPLLVARGVEAAYSRTRLTGGELLLTLVGTVGETAVVPNSMAGWNTARAVAVIPVQKEIGSYWVKLALRSPEVQQIIQSRLNTTVQATLNLGDVARLPIVLPPLPERRAIAHILGSLDDKIELNRRMNETLEAIVRALFQSWFIDFDPVRAKAEGRDPGLPKHLADFFTDSFEETELGDIPAGWRAVPLYETATYINGAAYAAFQPNEERRGLPILKIAELKSGVTKQTKYSDVGMPAKYRVTTEDILLSWSGNPDTSIDTFVWTGGDVWLNQHIFRVVANRANERAFVMSTLQVLRPTFAEIARNKQTTGLGHVTVADMRRLLVVWPDRRVLEAWHGVASPLQSQVLHHELENATLVRLRDTLLPKLISGELRVKDAEKFVERAAG